MPQLSPCVTPFLPLSAIIPGVPDEETEGSDQPHHPAEVTGLLGGSGARIPRLCVPPTRTDPIRGGWPQPAGPGGCWAKQLLPSACFCPIRARKEDEASARAAGSVATVAVGGWQRCWVGLGRAGHRNWMSWQQLIHPTAVPCTLPPVWAPSPPHQPFASTTWPCHPPTHTHTLGGSLRASLQLCPHLSPQPSTLSKPG